MTKLRSNPDVNAGNGIQLVTSHYSMFNHERGKSRKCCLKTDQVQRRIPGIRKEPERGMDEGIESIETMGL